MKITKRQLKRIIKEERTKLLKEQAQDPKRVFYDIILPALEAQGITGIDAFKTARAAVDAAFDDARQMFGV